MQSPSPPADVAPPDSSERTEDFLRRHGGAGTPPGDAGDIVPGVSGWTEVYAADGHTLRCEWSRFGSHHELRFIERPPPPR
jgi:hypothetical protein